MWLLSLIIKKLNRNEYYKLNFINIKCKCCDEGNINRKSLIQLIDQTSITSSNI